MFIARRCLHGALAAARALTMVTPGSGGQTIRRVEC